MNVGVTEIEFVVVPKQTTRTLRRPVVKLRVFSTSVQCADKQNAGPNRSASDF